MSSRFIAHLKQFFESDQRHDAHLRYLDTANLYCALHFHQREDFLLPVVAMLLQDYGI